MLYAEIHVQPRLHTSFVAYDNVSDDMCFPDQCFGKERQGGNFLCLDV